VPGSEDWRRGDAARPASRKSFADLSPAAGEFKESQYLCGPVPVRVSNDSNAGGLAAGIKLDPDRLKVCPDPVLQADREGTATHNNRPAAFEKASPFLTTRHQRPLTLIENGYRQTSSPNYVLTDLVTLPLRTISLGQVAEPRLSTTGFRAYPGLSLAFERLRTQEASGRRS
jgi:hypothetical protein